MKLDLPTRGMSNTLSPRTVSLELSFRVCVWRGSRVFPGCSNQGLLEQDALIPPPSEQVASACGDSVASSLMSFFAWGSLWECRSRIASWKLPAWHCKSSSGPSPQGKTQILPGRNPFIKLFQNWTVTSQRYSNLPGIPRRCFGVRVKQNEEWLARVSWVCLKW